ncbi:MAG: outer membrane protein assembly factor BamE [Rhodoferax sp.]|nr:outer membrane protein assembly factor BamE [Rhodoferax sp.]MCF8210053.1 outer membrane protein assembly factor BamE [Rhodoferax sp.]
MSELSRRGLGVLSLGLWAAAALTGCGSFDRASATLVSVVTPYKMDVVQGNVVTREQIAALQPGMSRNQVRDVLGTALLVSVFHADRWDYVFTLKRQRVEAQSRRVTVFFKNERMERVDADDLPSESEFVATLKSGTSSSRLPDLEATPDSLNAFPVAPKAPAPTGVPASGPASYPPLEPATK